MTAIKPNNASLREQIDEDSYNSTLNDVNSKYTEMDKYIGNLSSDIQLLKQDLDHVKQGQVKMMNDITMIKKTLLDPDHGTIAKVNRNTDFRKKANTALWTVWGVVVGLVAKLIFWD